MSESDERRATLKKQKALNKKLGGTALAATSNAYYKDKTTGVTSDIAKNGTNQYYGKWLKPSKEDQYIKDFDTIRQTEIGKDSNPDPNRLINALKDGQANADFYNISSLATLISDHQNPFLEMHAKQVWPSLKTVPEENYRDNLVLQASLHRVLDNGVITSEEDLQLMYYLSRPDALLPIFPVWDPSGALVAPIMNTTTFRNFIGAVPRINNLFHPYSIWSNKGNDGAAVELNLKLKTAIFKRVFPGLREQDDKVVGHFITRLQTRDMGMEEARAVLQQNKNTIPNAYFSTPKEV